MSDTRRPRKKYTLGTPKPPGHGKHKVAATGAFVVEPGSCPKACRHTYSSACSTWRAMSGRNYEEVMAQRHTDELRARRELGVLR